MDGLNRIDTARMVIGGSLMRPLAKMLLVVLMGFALSSFQASATESQFSTSPTTNNGQKWRIGYYEGGAHNNYYDYLVATMRGLMVLGWLENREIPFEKDRDTEALWQWLGENVKSDYIEFPKGAYYSAGWDQDVRNTTRDEIVKRLNEKSDIDVIIAMGTWAGQDLANDRHATPTMVMSSSDPVKSGIIKDVEDSGFDHVHARVDPFRYERQVEVFHDIIGFKKLGVAFEDSLNGRSYAAIDLIEKVAQNRGFEVVRCYTQSDIADKTLAGESVKNCFEELAQEVDAIYVTVQGGVNSETIPELVAIANEHGVATFSQLGSEEVKYGFLLSISRAGGFKPVGLFLAATAAKIFNGAKPRQLNQIFEEVPNLAINLKTAEKVGLYLYAAVLAASDEIYRDIEVPQ